MTKPTTQDDALTVDAETARLHAEAHIMLCRLVRRLNNAMRDDDAGTIKWHHKQAVSWERRAQEREATT